MMRMLTLFSALFTDEVVEHLWHIKCSVLAIYEGRSEFMMTKLAVQRPQLQ